MAKIVSGVGINDFGAKISNNGVHIRSYATWKSMLDRCYNKLNTKRRPTYIGCSVCESWISFSNFKQWYDTNYITGFELDKDILIPGNKVYSPEACRFVPPYLNKLLNDHGNRRGDLPVGVSQANKGRCSPTYTAFCNNGYGFQLNKTFKSIPEAVDWYAETKKVIVKEQAVRAFMANSIDTDVYLALVRREF